MKQTLRKLALALALTAMGGASPCLAQAGGEPALPVPVAESHYREKGPVKLLVYDYSEEDKRMSHLGLVKRSTVVGANAAEAAVGVSMLLLTGSGHMRGFNKEHFYGKSITDARDMRKIASGFKSDLPAALDRKIIQIIGDSPDPGAAPFKNTLTIMPLNWSLAYNELMADKDREDEYILRFSAQFSKVLEGEEDGFLRKARKIERVCHYTSPPRKLAAWTEGDYDAVAAEQKLAIEVCVDSIAKSLPLFLGLDSAAKIRTAKLNCKNELNVCVAESDKAPDAAEAKKACNVEYKQCVSEDVKPLVDATPVGQCKATFATCKAAVIEKSQALNPDVKPAKSEFAACTTEYKACVAHTK